MKRKVIDVTVDVLMKIAMCFYWVVMGPTWVIAKLVCLGDKY